MAHIIVRKQIGHGCLGGLSRTLWQTRCPAGSLKGSLQKEKSGTLNPKLYITSLY